MRLEHDCLDEMEMPDEVCYGAQTRRARENFSLSGVTALTVTGADAGTLLDPLLPTEREKSPALFTAWKRANN